MKFIKSALSIAVFALLVSCGSKKIVTGEGVVSDDATAASVISSHYKEEIEFETLQARLRVRYDDGSSAQSLTVSMRMEKDSTIWLSGSVLGVTLAKVMITPERVQYYEKLSGSYYDGNYELLSDWLGIDLNYQKVQNLLIGQSIYNLRAEKFVSEESPKGYKLVPVQEPEALVRIFHLSPANYKIMAEQISQPAENRHVTIQYPEYQVAQERLVPNQIKIIASDTQGNTNVNIEYTSVDFNTPVSFPFSIPSGYSEITIQ